MSSIKVFQCIVDDTALITNISEIETWVMRGTVHLVIPLHTLERLHLLKKDTSQIGQNARKAVKFLDDATSNPESASRVIIQGPDDSYPTWAEVEAHYADSATRAEKKKSKIPTAAGSSRDERHNLEKEDLGVDAAGNMSRLIEKLEVSKDVGIASPMSTPPLSPSSSGPQSSKTSPEVQNASIITSDVSPVPQSLKPLLNPIVWFTRQAKNSPVKDSVIFLTNSSDNGYLARDFGVRSKNIHQLRAAIGTEQQEAKNQTKYQKKHGHSPNVSGEAKTLFRYEEDSDEEEVVFKPRGRGGPRNSGSTRGGNTGSTRSRKGPGHSPANSLSVPPLPTALTAQKQLQIPVEEIDPDSFDRGSFGRGSAPLANASNVQNPQPNMNTVRSNAGRGSGGNAVPSRGGYQRGGRTGMERGSARGRGRLFVP